MGTDGQSEPAPAVAARPPGRLAYAMRALGRAGLPGEFRVADATYHLEREVKHDFWAATGFYLDESGRRVVLKVGRATSFFGFPLRFAGRWLCRRETRFYRNLADLPNVPALLGLVGDTGFAHDYVEGRPLSRDKPVPNGFFAQLRGLLGELHRRGIAYVDTNKPENILLGEDGRPHLIDFQISWDRRTLGGNWFLSRWWVRRLQAEDLYHIAKHQRRLRPDEMSPDELAQANRRSPLIRLHRALTKPYFFVRRRAFRRLRASGRLLPEGSK